MEKDWRPSDIQGCLGKNCEDGVFEKDQNVRICVLPNPQFWRMLIIKEAKCLAFVNVNQLYSLIFPVLSQWVPEQRGHDYRDEGFAWAQQPYSLWF